MKGVHHTITAEVELKDDKTQGVIIAQAGYFGGWVLYMKDGKPHHEYNWFALERTNIAGDTALAPGKHTISYEFIPDAAKPGTGGKSILSVDGKKVAEGQIPKTQPFAFSADEGADVGLDGETNVSPDYKQGDNAFTGKIVKVTVSRNSAGGCSESAASGGVCLLHSWGGMPIGSMVPVEKDGHDRCCVTVASRMQRRTGLTACECQSARACRIGGALDGDSEADYCCNDFRCCFCVLLLIMHRTAIFR